MEPPEQMFLITKTPAGEAPQWVREAWIGIRLPLAPSPWRGPSYGVLSGQIVESKSGYQCLVVQAITALFNAEQISAARWWIEWQQKYPVSDNDTFTFNLDECELVL